MAINFPDSPTNGQQTSAGGNTWQYNSAKSVWEKTLTSGRSSLGIATYANISDLPLSGVSAGKQAFVTGSNRLYISNGTGWYSIGLVNTNPAITSVQDSAAGTTPFTLTTDGTATVITITAADPEGFPLTYNYSVTSGSLTNGGGTTATVGQGTGEGYAIASASLLSGTHTVNANVGALTFKPDGTEMYYVGTHNDRVNRHTLSTAWDVSTASFVGSSPNTLSQVSQLTDAKFNNDGTKMYMADKSTNTIYQYSLSTAWNIGTASYDNKSYDFSTQLTSDELNCFVFNNDGSAVYLAELGTSRDIFQYTLSTPFDISTASYASKSLSLASVASNGYIGRQYFQFTNDGSKLFLIHTFHPAGFVGKIYEYSLTTAYDISTASHTSVTYTPTGITTGRSAIAFKPDGSKMFIMGTDNHTTISQFNLPVYNANQFTITPTTTEAHAGTFELTFTTSDGINTATSANSFTLNFITIVTNSKYTTLLATATGTSDNNNITDTSSNNHTITVNGPAHAGTFSPYRSGGYSTYFDGNDYLTTTQTTPLGTADFTIEGWINFDNVGGNRTFMTLDSTTQLYFRNNGSSIAIYKNSSAYNFSTGTPEVNTWYHFAFVRQSGSVTLYWNGQSKGSTSHAHDYTIGNLHIGCWSAISEFFQGHLTDIKISNTAAYTSNFSVPTERLSSDSSTKLLICHLPYIADGSNLNETIAVNGDPTTKPLSPYDILEYSATDHGGSVYFGGGTREHLSTSLPAFGTQDFEVEFWIYGGALTSSTWYTLFSRDYNVNGSFRIYCAAGSDVDKFIYIANGTAYNYTSAGKIRDNVWNHILLSRVSGTAKWFINGIEDTSWSDSQNMTSTATLYIGDTGADETSNSSYPFVGYMSDIAIRMGGSGYRTSSFTSPTAPLSSTGAELHIKGTDASIIDKSQGANLKLIGTTTGSTGQVRTGDWANTKTMYFDGNSDYITIPNNELYGFGTGDWTIETWLYCTKTGGFNAIFDTRVGTGTQSGNFGIGMYNTGRVQLFSGGIFYYPTNTLSFNTWQHLAVVKNSGTTTMYFNGTAASTTYSDSRNYGSSQPVQIGKDDTASNYFGGYMQDFRISKGKARYTANFTPPSAPLEG